MILEESTRRDRFLVDWPIKAVPQLSHRGDISDGSPNSRPVRTASASLGHAEMSTPQASAALTLDLLRITTMSQPLIFVGIDVSKDHLDVAFRPTGAATRFTNDERGIAALLARLKDAPPALIVLESTGGYEQAVAVALTEAGFPTRIIDPAVPAGSRNRSANMPRPTPLTPASWPNSPRRCVPRRTASPMPRLWNCRRCSTVGRSGSACGPPSATVGSKARPPWLKRAWTLISNTSRRKSMNWRRRSPRMSQAHPEWGPRNQLLKSIPGVGAADGAHAAGPSARAGHPDGQTDRGAGGPRAAPRDSGKKQGDRSIYGGRKEVRTMMYMAALSATTPQSGPESGLPPTGRVRQKEEGSVDGGGPQTLDDRQRRHPRHATLDA